MNNHSNHTTFYGLGRYLTQAPKPRIVNKEVLQAMMFAKN